MVVGEEGVVGRLVVAGEERPAAHVALVGTALVQRVAVQEYHVTCKVLVFHIESSPPFFVVVLFKGRYNAATRTTSKVTDVVLWLKTCL